jgi:cytochrome c biogenesis protein CcmG, thiol:disulfide interchange protein DsbE
VDLAARAFVWLCRIESTADRPFPLSFEGGSSNSSYKAKFGTALEPLPDFWLYKRKNQADDGGRTRDLKLGKLALYQLSYVRAWLILRPARDCRGEPRSNLGAVSARAFAAVLAVLAVVGLLTYGLLSKGSSGVNLGEPAPAGALPRLEGAGTGSLADYRGRWVLVNFWASWCGPCRQEAPTLESFQHEHGGPGFTVLGVDTRDLSGDGQRFVREFGLSYPQLRDGDGQAAHDFGTTGVPENFLIDGQGKVRLLRHGPVTAEYLRQYVAPMLPKARS